MKDLQCNLMGISHISNSISQIRCLRSVEFDVVIRRHMYIDITIGPYFSFRLVYDILVAYSFIVVPMNIANIQCSTFLSNLKDPMMYGFLSINIIHHSDTIYK